MARILLALGISFRSSDLLVKEGSRCSIRLNTGLEMPTPTPYA